MKNCYTFLLFAQNTYCGYMLKPPYRGDSNEYPQSMLWIKNKKNVYPFTSQFYLYPSIQKVYFTPVSRRYILPQYPEGIFYPSIQKVYFTPVSRRYILPQYPEGIFYPQYPEGIFYPSIQKVYFTPVSRRYTIHGHVFPLFSVAHYLSS